jgi:hypothetical protein
MQGSTEHDEIDGGVPLETKTAGRRIRLINGARRTDSQPADLLPLAACGCDADTQVCVGDVHVTVPVTVCGVWG